MIMSSLQCGTIVTMLALILATLSNAIMVSAAGDNPLPISFNNTFGSHMVLQQQPAQACVYGLLGDGGTAATIEIVGTDTPLYKVQATIMKIGSQLGWKACLHPTVAGGDFTITAVCDGCTNATTAVINNVTFGDVWYCGGQSNMALPLLHSFTRNTTRDNILNGKYDNIRIHGMEDNMNPQQDWTTLKDALAVTPSGISGISATCDPASDSDCSAFMRFPATCYYYGESLSDALAARNNGQAPPIGLINTAFGGSTIEQWLSNDTIATCDMAGESSSNQEWHDARVLPYVSMTVKGWVWYQGENDMHGVMGNSISKTGYSCLMKALINEWRTLWSATPNTTSPNAPFGLVTLASSGSEGANSLAMGSMRQAQTAGAGVLPGSGMGNTFFAQAYDLDDEWNTVGPCFDIGFNTTSTVYNCCGRNVNRTTCPIGSYWANKCKNACASIDGTTQYMGGIHPRSKRPVGQRLATAAFNTVYGGTAAYTGPVLSGCSLSSSELTIEFNTTILRGDRVVLQPYARPNFTPYYHGHGNPGFHSGSQLYVQTVASSFCAEYLSINTTNSSSPVYCPKWAGGAGKSVTKPAPAGRFPTFGGDGMTPSSDPNEFNMGWINLPIKAGSTPSSISVDLTPLKGAVPTAVKYAWGIIDCCDITDPDLYATHGCIANCPIMATSGLPANPFIAKITNSKCECIAPQVCSE